MRYEDKRFILFGAVLTVAVQLSTTSSWSTVSSLDCSSCHNMPPIDAGYRNVSTGAFRGNHSTHNPSAAHPADCERCHPGSISYSTGHRNGFIHISTNINGSPHPSKATYDKTRFFNQTSNPVLKSCANVNCHFESTTPNWSSPVYSSIEQCTQCHEGAVPLSAAHAAHRRYSSSLMGKFTTFAACASCHVNYATPLNFSHATSAGHRPIKVTIGDYNSGSTTFLPSQSHGPFGTCVNLYCHSPGTKPSAPFAAPTQTPTWGATLRADCSGCHKGGAASYTCMSSGSHNKHVHVYRIDCVSCHATTVNSGLTLKDSSKHVNGTVEVSFNGTNAQVNGRYNGSPVPVSNAPGSGYGSCSNTDCHSDGTFLSTGTTPVNASPQWGAGAVPCSGCHGFPPSNANGNPKANSHATHAAAGFGCNTCHSATTTNGTAIADSARHVNGTYDVIPGTGISFTYVFATSGGTCTDISCHNNGSAVWGPALTCGSCHSISPGGD